MIADDVVFHKTPTGKEALRSSRETDLPRNLRSILILIDGKKAYMDYKRALANSRLVRGIGSVDECFRELLKKSFIQTDSSHAPDLSPPTPAREPQIPASPNTAPGSRNPKFLEIRAIAIECIERELGAQNWAVTLDFERCDSPQELQSVISRTYSAEKRNISREGKKILKSAFDTLAKITT